MKRRGIYLALCTDPEGHSCFTVKHLQNQSDKKLTSHFLELACPHTFWARGALLSSPPPALAVNIFISAVDYLLRENRGSVNRLFLNERRHFNNKSSFRFNWQCFGDLSSALSRFCCKFNRIKIFYLSVNLNNPNSFAFLAFVGTAASFDARMNSFETAMKRDTILTPIPKRRIAKDIASYRSQSNCTKLVSTDLVHFIGR